MTLTRAGHSHGVGAAIWTIGLFTQQFAAQPALAADMLWDNINGGFFSEPLNWFGGVPGTIDVARFETTDSNFVQREYIVDFTTDITNLKLVVEDDGVTFNLMGHVYSLTHPSGAVALGTVPNRSGDLTVTNGRLQPPTGSDLTIALVADGEGSLTVGAGGRVNTHMDVIVGLNGEGTLMINSGGLVAASDVRLGGSSAEVIVTGNGSLLRTLSNLDMLTQDGPGTLRIENGGGILVGGVLLLGGNDAIFLDGGELFVHFLPRLDQGSFFWTSGTLAFLDCQADDLTIPDGGVLAIGEAVSNLFTTSHTSGNLTLLPGSTTKVTRNPFNFDQFSQIHVDGHVALDGGSLQLSLDSGLPPNSEAKFEIITSGLGISGSFANVANGQRLATTDRLGSFLVNYGPESPFDPKSVFISSFQPATPGDFDVDGDVDGTDLLLWQRRDSPNQGNLADLVAWRVRFAASASPTAGVLVAEPCTAAGFMLASFAIHLSRSCRPGYFSAWERRMTTRGINATSRASASWKSTTLYLQNASHR